MFEFISEKIQETARKLTGKAYLTDASIRDAVQELKRTLLAADVHYRVVKDFVKSVKEKALGQKIAKSLSPGQAFLKIVYEELVRILGEKPATLQLKRKPALVFLVGIQGAGKTTFAGKLAKWLLEEHGKTSLLVCADSRRPAAYQQLEQIARKISTPIFPPVESYTNWTNTSPENLIDSAWKYARQHGFDVVIVDTAGRQATQEELIQEVAHLIQKFQPDEVLYVLDALMGQSAVTIARDIYSQVPFTGVVLTRMDSDARGGSALTVYFLTRVPIKFVSTGEKPEDLEPFYPDRYAQRILGAGDLQTLFEKLRKTYKKEEVQDLARRISRDEFTMEDLLQQFRMLRKVDNWKGLLSMIPGMGKALASLPEDTEKRIKHLEAIILSMTPEERKNPEIIDYSRKMRIARGSGRPLHEVNRLLKQYRQLKKVFRKVRDIRKHKRFWNHPALLQMLQRQNPGIS